MFSGALFVVDDWDQYWKLRHQFPHDRIVHVDEILDAALLTVVYKFSAVVISSGIDTQSDWFLGEVISRMEPGAPVYKFLIAGGARASPEEPETRTIRPIPI